MQLHLPIVVSTLAASLRGPEELVGTEVIVVANLKPAKLMGIESQGMVLAAGDVDRLQLAGFAADVAPGTKVK